MRNPILIVRKQAQECPLGLQTLFASRMSSLPDATDLAAAGRAANDGMGDGYGAASCCLA